MSWPMSGPVDERDDYRDRAFVERVLRAAAHGVLLAGVSRSGKTTLLSRLREAAPARFGALVSLERGPKATLAKLSALPGVGLLLDEGQLLLRWPPAAQQKLIEALEDRPFVLAAWPSLFDPSASEELRRWLERPRFERLLPLSREETAAMIKRARSDKPAACDDAITEAVFAATGGHPALVARLCNFLSDNGTRSLRHPDDSSLELFVEGVRQFNDPFAAMLASLPRAHQGAVKELARGERRALAWLIEHGLACDDPPRYSGSLFTLAWREIAETRTTPTPTPPPPPPPPSSKPLPRLVPAFYWVHLSDIHFGAGDRSRAFDRIAVARAIREDAQRMAKRLGPPDRIFVTGDIAQRADPREYEEAYAFLRELTEATGASLGEVRLVPGNHDVDRGAAEQLVTRRAHEAIRGRPEELDEDLFDAQLRAHLAGKLAAYQRFVGERFPAHPPPGVTGLDWVEALPAAPGKRGKVRIAGLSTVWVSDRFDGRDKQSPDSGGLCRNLVVSRGQIERTLGAAEADALLFVLAHHPPEWLDPKSATWLANALTPHAHVHLTGHVHDAHASALRRLGQSGAAFHYIAGALHGDPTETYGYAWGGVRWSEARGGFEVGWAPRVYMAELQRVVANRNRYPDLDERDFAWEPIALGWAVPSGAHG